MINDAVELGRVIVGRSGVEVGDVDGEAEKRRYFLMRAMKSFLHTHATQFTSDFAGDSDPSQTRSRSFGAVCRYGGVCSSRAVARALD